MSFLSILSGWQVKLIILITVLIIAFSWHKIEVNKAVTEAVAEIELNLAKENFKLKERSLDAQIALQESFDKIQKDKDAKIKNLNTRVASLTRSLQERPSRPEPSGISNDSRVEEGKSGGTGTGLYREDSEFLLGEATRAELIKGELLSCYKSYDAVKEVLDKYKKENESKIE